MIRLTSGYYDRIGDMGRTSDEETIEAESLSTSLDPYGQLFKMLMPRAASIAIYDRMAVPLWLSDGYDGHNLAQLVEEALNAAQQGLTDPNERDGFARTWDGETSYVFILRDRDTLLGALAISCQDGPNGARPFTMVQGLLRPAVQVLGRELAHQYNIDDLRRDLSARDGDLALLLGSDAAGDETGEQDFAHLLHNVATHLECSYGALLVPDKKIAETYASDALGRNTRERLESAQRNLVAWTQVQRRSLLLNKAPANSPVGQLACKLLACPIRHGAHEVEGLLLLVRPAAAADFANRELRIAEMLARRLASVLQNSFDPSTGLLTRPAFEQRALATLAAGAADAQHCVAYLDVDRLHVLNEQHGMHVGDEAIRRIADVLSARLSADRIGARLAGDRFAVFLPHTALESACAFAEELCRAVANTALRHDGAQIDLSVSIGVAAVPNTKLPLTHALAAAESACKAAKERGRARVETYGSCEQATEPEPPQPQRVRVAPKRHDDATSIESLREAVENDRFRMDAQPIVQLSTKGAARHFELLLRMVDQGAEDIAPDTFLAAAERHQLASRIDRWVVHYVLELLSPAAPALEALGAHFAINICGQSLDDETFADYLESKLREYELPTQLLSFEISESAAVASIVRAEMLIRRLKDLGYGIALDDFGHGLSSLGYLKSLPVSHLKIDGALVRGLAAGNDRSPAMIKAIVELAQKTNLTTTAKCVESEAILFAVEELGVDYGQGFAIGRPRPLEIVLQELLRAAPGSERKSGPRLARLGGL